MKKIVLSIVAIAAMTSSVFAQEKALAPSGFGSNWFIQLQGGATYSISEGFKDASFGDLITPHVAVSLGKYFAPQVGGRLQVGGWSAKHYDESTNGTFKTQYIQTNADGLFNLTNIFLPYQENRPFNFILIAGLGYVHGFKDTKNGLTTTNMIVPRAGLQADFRLSEMASFNIEVAGNLLRDDFNGIKRGKNYDGTINLLAGVSLKLSKDGFKLVDVQDPAQIKALNDRINQQRASLDSKDIEINRLQQELAVKPEPEIIIKETKVEELGEVLMNAVVVFRIGSSKLEQNQDINIYNAARYLIDNPNVSVIVTGYADSSTGTATINQRLSEQRAEAVARILIDKYEISPNRITTKAAGDKIQLFPTPQWNRVVVFTAIAQ